LAGDVWLLDEDLNSCAVSGKPCLTGEGVTIGIIDTGVDYTHPDLGGCFGTGCKVVDGYDFYNDDNDPMDDKGHGTHVAATAAGNGVLKGVAPDANIVAYKVLDSGGSGPISGIIAAVDRSVDPNQDGDFSDHLDIISMSLGVPCWAFGYPEDCGPNDPLNMAVDNAVDIGVTVVAAAGNSGTRSGETIGSPGTARRAITVGATDKNDVLADFSSKGPVTSNDVTIDKPDIVAPGVLICSARMPTYTPWSNNPIYAKCLDNSYVLLSGTSMATPHVSGAAALLKQAYPQWTPDEIKNVLKDSSDGLPYSSNEVGSGRLNILSAVGLREGTDIAQINTYGRVNGIINIEGIVYSNDFDSYSLYYGNGPNPSTWIELLTSTFLPSEEIIYENFDTSLLDDGIYALKLIMRKNDGSEIEHKDYIIVSNAYISFPKSYGNKLLPLDYIILSKKVFSLGDGTINIEGTAKGTNFKNYKLEIGKENNWFTSGIEITNNGNDQITNSELGKLNVGEVMDKLGTGFFTLKLTVIEINGKTKEYPIVIAIEDYKKGWPQGIETGILPQMSTSVGDIDNDGDLEVIGVGGDGDDMHSSIFAWHADGSLVSGWPKLLGIPSWPFDIVSFTPSLADIDNDGDLEIFVMTSKGKIYAFHNNGVIVNGWINKKVSGTFGYYDKASPSIGDIDNDGDLEIVAPGGNTPSINPKVFAWHADGSLVSGWPIEIPVPTFNGIKSGIGITPSLADLDKDGDLEIVIGSNSYLYIFNHDGTVMSGWPKTVCINENSCIGTFGRPLEVSPVIGDINNDGDLEIVVLAEGWGDDGDSSVLHVFNKDGSEIAGFPLELPNGYHTKDHSISLGDVNSDGYLEIVFTAYTAAYTAANFIYNVIIVNHDGTYLWGPGYKELIDEDGNSLASQGAILADIDNDNNIEIIVDAGYNEGRIFAWNSDGTIVDNFPKIIGASHMGSVLSLNDLEKDGNIDLIGSFENGVYVFEIRKPYDPKRVEWGMFANNVRHTGLYQKGPSPICTDSDSDGYNIEGGACGQVDCNDNNVNVNPGATEICNGVDDNCVNGIDETGNALCDDSIVCTDNVCLGLSGCGYVENHLSCQDGVYCNGVEFCSISEIGCVVGTAVDCSDAYSCTVDSCNEVDDKCVNVESNDNCNEGEVCSVLNFDSGTGCGASCQDKDGDGLYEYDFALCPTGRDVCGDSDDSFFEDNPTEFDNFVPESGLYDISEVNVDNVFNHAGFSMELTNIGKVEFREFVKLIRIDEQGCFEKLDFGLESFMKIEDKKVFINSNFHKDFDKPARITFRNVDFIEPKVLRDGVECSVCSVVSYADGAYVVDVPGFSEYEVVEGYVAPSDGGGGGGGSGGGGGGGGGSGTFVSGVSSTSGECIEIWSCDSWIECVDDKQSRECIDLGGCETEERKPELEQECKVLEVEEVGGEIVEEDVEVEKGIDRRVAIGVIVGVLVLVIVMWLVVRRRRRKKVRRKRAKSRGESR